MINIKIFKKDINKLLLILKDRNFKFKIDKFYFLENIRKKIQVKIEKLQNKRKILSKQIFYLKKNKKNILHIKKKVFEINNFLKIFKIKFKEIKNKINIFLYKIPNIPHISVPINNKNIEIKKNGKFKIFKFKIKDHVNIGKNLGLNLKIATKITGSKFMVMKGKIAKIYRALSQFMIDIHTKEHGYTEYYIPYIVNEKSLFCTGQLPKFKKDLFKIKNNIQNNQHQSLYLIPTAEVSLTNLVSDKILSFKDLPLKMVAYSPCFRLESKNYGKDTRGIIRQHQFDKVEMVQITHPDKSYFVLEEMINHAENILKKLDLPYRIIKLCSKEISFSSAKTYDIEVWLPSQKKYQEISSISNCEDFQARRMCARFKNKKGNIKLVHTLNGSGLAIGRTLIALLENYQQENGNIIIPKILNKYIK